MAIIDLSPSAPGVYDKERNVTWDEIAPSLQAKFNNLSKEIDDSINKVVNLIGRNRITIGPNPPDDPEPDREIWFDTRKGEESVKFFMDKDGGTSYTWEITKAAWYGGDPAGITKEAVAFPTGDWYKLATLAYVSNPAKNNTFDPNGDIPLQAVFKVPADGDYYVRNVVNLFPYNAQKAYTHDGGSLNVEVFVNATSMFSNLFESKTNYCTGLDGTFPEGTYTLSAGDNIVLRNTIVRNPQSTDDLDIYMSSTLMIYRKNTGATSTAPAIDGSSFNTIWRDTSF